MIEGVRCNTAGGPAIIYFGGPLPIEGGAATSASGSVEVGRFTVDAAGHFSGTFQIPVDLRPIQGSGGGPVAPGPYAFYSKPTELCLTPFTVDSQ